MQQHIQRFTQKAIANKKILFVFLGLIAAIAGIVAINISSKDSLAAVGAPQSAGGPEVEIAVAGATSSADIGSIDNSWPGELISLGNVPVQPPREGTIASWDVHIGQVVYAGQVLGTLSPSPAMPDTVAMLAEKAGEAAMSRANIDAKRTYATERIVQLTALRDNTERSLQESQALLGGDAENHTDLPMIAAKQETERAILRGTFAKTYPLFSGNAALPTKWSAVTLASAIGAQNSRLRDQFSDVLFAVKADLDTPGKSTVTSGLAYYDLMIKLADASLPDGGTLTNAALTELKTMLHADQQAFISAVDEEKKTELMAVDTKKESFERLRAIENEIATLRQDLAMAEGDASAKEAAYRTVKDAAQGISAIIAPKSGRISAIMKKPGEFVGPGMPVAVLTGEEGNELIVRFRIPSNIRTPEIGQKFHVTRPGFPEIMSSAKLIGVGSALDETGSVMADAILLNPVDWPIGVSVRVISASEAGTLSIALSSVWWDVEGAPNIWVVSEGGRVYAKKVSLGRTLGETVEVYGGLVRGDRYVAKPAQGIREDMLLDEIKASGRMQKSESTYEEAMRAMGM